MAGVAVRVVALVLGLLVSVASPTIAAKRSSPKESTNQVVKKRAKKVRSKKSAVKKKTKPKQKAVVQQQQKNKGPEKLKKLEAPVPATPPGDDRWTDPIVLRDPLFLSTSTRLAREKDKK